MWITFYLFSTWTASIKAEYNFQEHAKTQGILLSWVLIRQWASDNQDYWRDSSVITGW